MPLTRGLHIVWLGVHLLLLVTLGLGIVLPFLGSDAIGLLPWHDHVVVGGTAADRAYVLAHHHHGLVLHTHLYEQTLPAAGNAQVIFVPTHDLGVSVIGLVGGALLMADPLLPPMLPDTGQRLRLSTVSPVGVDLGVPDPPPRPSL
jgi:hypothetical protein